jgi:hypothetical protein
MPRHLELTAYYLFASLGVVLLSSEYVVIQRGGYC